MRGDGKFPPINNIHIRAQRDRGFPRPFELSHNSSVPPIEVQASPTLTLFPLQSVCAIPAHCKICSYPRKIWESRWDRTLV